MSITTNLGRYKDISTLIGEIKTNPLKITEVKVGGEKLGDSGVKDLAVKDLAEALRGTNVTKLDLTGNYIGDKGTKALAKALRDTNVTTLDLTGNKIGAAGAKDLVEGLMATNVTELSLFSNKIGAAGAKALAEGLRGTNVTKLDLTGNGIGDEGAKALAKALRDTNVTRLDLHCNEIGAAGAKDLAEALRGTNVTELDLAHNKIGAAGAKALAEGLRGTNVTKLRLTGNKIGDEGARDLLEALRGTNVTELYLGRNNIGAAEAKALAEALRGTKVTRLDLHCNEIGDEGAKALVEGLRGTNVTKLRLSHNEIGDEGARALVEALRNTNVTDLDLYGNGIGDEEAKALAEVIKQNKITILTRLGVEEESLDYFQTSTLFQFLPYVEECINSGADKDDVIAALEEIDKGTFLLSDFRLKILSNALFRNIEIAQSLDAESLEDKIKKLLSPELYIGIDTTDLVLELYSDEQYNIAKDLLFNINSANLAAKLFMMPNPENVEEKAVYSYLLGKALVGMDINEVINALGDSIFHKLSAKTFAEYLSHQANINIEQIIDLFENHLPDASFRDYDDIVESFSDNLNISIDLKNLPDLDFLESHSWITKAILKSMGPMADYITKLNEISQSYGCHSGYKMHEDGDPERAEEQQSKMPISGADSMSAMGDLGI